MTQFTTRLLTADDLPDVFDMVRALAAYNADVATLTMDALQQDALGDCPWITVIVAEKSKSIIGYAALCPLAQLQFGVRGMDIHHLFVTQSERGKGVGQSLIKASINHAKARNCRYIMIGTQPENIAAQQIYLSAGFDAIAAPGPRFRMRLGAG